MFLDKIGFSRIVRHNIFLSISFYAMNSRAYQNVTGSDNFDRMMNNVLELINRGYKSLMCRHILSRRSIEGL